MKSAIFAAMLLASGAALAQTETTTDAGMAVPSEAVLSTGQLVAPGNTDPERDARGIAVISDPAVAPLGFNQPAGVPGMGGPLADASSPPPSQPATQDYPACSRTVTDHCVQAYERGRSPTQ